MKPRRLLQELEQVARALDLSVRTQPFRTSVLSPGGLCKVRGEPVVLLNSRSSENERALILGEVLRQMETSGVSMSEEVREFIVGHRRPQGSKGSDGASSAGPGLRRARPKPSSGHE